MSNSVEMDEESLGAALARRLLDGDTLAEAVGLSDGCLESIYSVAYQLYQGGQYERAGKVFRFLCVYHQYDPRFFTGAAACLQMQGQYVKALEHYAMALILDKDSPDVPLQTARCLLALGRHGEAGEALEACRRLAGEDGKRQEEIRALASFVQAGRQS